MTNLAYLLRLENVGVLLGAGASVGANGMTMQELWNNFISEIEENESEFLIAHKIVHPNHLSSQQQPSADEPQSVMDTTTTQTVTMPSPALQQQVSQSSTDVQSGQQQLEPEPTPGLISEAASGQPQPAPDIEAIFDRLAVAMAHWERTDESLLKFGKEIQYKLYRSLISASELNADWWETPDAPDLSVPELSDHREMLQKLSSIRQPGQPSPWIFTTNYDLAVEWAADSIDLSIINGFLGVHSRKFTPQSFDLGYRNVQTRGEARFGTYNIYLAKLHGSLTWRQYPDGQFYEVQATEAWKSISEFREGSINEIPFTVAPSAAKYVQTVGFLYGELMRRFAEFTGRSQTVLFISGYGFGDEHINRLLQSALLNPTLQLVIYVYELQNKDDVDKLPKPIKDLIGTRSSRITVIGGSFGDFTSDMPDPAIYNSDLKEIRELLGRNGDKS